METYRRERHLTQTLRKLETWLARFNEHGDAGAAKSRRMLSLVRRELRRRQGGSQ